MAALASPNVLLYATPNTSADMRWFSQFQASDPLLALSAGRKKVGVVSLLEVTRARKESAFDEVLNLQDLLAEVRASDAIAEVVLALAAKHGIRAFAVPPDFPASLYQRITALGLKLEIGEVPFFRQRVVKNDAEIAAIRAANRASAAGFKAVEKILAASEIRRGKVWHGGRVLTSEHLKAAVEQACLAAGALNVTGLIVAAADQAVDCHCSGSGAIPANALIVVDIYPRSSATGYFGDMTRTYLKGRATAEQRRLVNTVRAAQKAALAAIKPGRTGAAVYKVVKDFFETRGYATGVNAANGYQEGFFHGLGHGLGLDVHEEPSLGTRGTMALRTGMVVTVEPGLYYLGLGGCRIEDVVVVTAGGCELLSRHPYRWEFA